MNDETRHHRSMAEMAAELQEIAADRPPMNLYCEVCHHPLGLFNMNQSTADLMFEYDRRHSAHVAKGECNAPA